MKKYKKKFDIFKILIEKQDPVIVEIGAHYGEDSVRFTEVFDNATIYCFEPDPRNIAIFKKYIQDPRIKLFECALSNEEGHATFYQSYQELTQDQVPEKYDWISPDDYRQYNVNSSGASSLKKGFSDVVAESIMVQTKRYDLWSKENNVTNVDIAWIDTQGSENLVIEGMGNEISNIKLIWIEYGETFYEGGMSKQETIKLLSSRGFEVLKDFPSDLSKGDLLFVRQGAM